VLRAYLIVLAGFCIGLLGAAAFNPDDGFVVHSEALWRIFGITAYIAIAAGFLLVLAAIGHAVLRLARLARRAHRRSV
jgi:NADH:ubiquinone oxidoreductase subunit 5 (subunit L)/multisubunit Na+/H+ antiporter MnhA subunit